METILFMVIAAVFVVFVWQWIDYRKTTKKLDAMREKRQKKEMEAINGLQAATKAINDKTVELFQSLGGES